jgi:hypothetical protein
MHPSGVAATVMQTLRKKISRSQHASQQLGLTASHPVAGKWEPRLSVGIELGKREELRQTALLCL